jgi:aerobic carbon-monoxide dehydrogenase small subunit
LDKQETVVLNETYLDTRGSTGMEDRQVLIELHVNQVPCRLTVDPSTTLLEVLRRDLGLKGTKRGCDQGHCGACTVILDGKAVNACMVLAVQADGKRVTTIEGLSSGDRLHPLQEAFVEEGALQCGFCTPGMILSAKALLDKARDPSEQEIREALSGNLCRCSGYVTIVKAVRKAAVAVRTSPWNPSES